MSKDFGIYGGQSRMKNLMEGQNSKQILTYLVLRGSKKLRQQRRRADTDNRGNRQRYVVINYKQFATFDYESADEAIGAFADVSSSMLLPYVCQFPATATTDEKLW